jgi:hypothetical protein
MDAGRTVETVAQAGKGAVTWIWDVVSRTSGALAVIMRFLGKRAERIAARLQGANARLERLARWSRAKAMRVPLGADLAEEWEEPEALPVAPTPPPIPPAAFFQPKRTTEEEDWGAVIQAAKHNTPEPSTADEWEAALLAAKKSPATPVPVTTAPAAAASEPAPAPVEPPAATVTRVTAKIGAAAPRAVPARESRSAPRPMRRTAELTSVPTGPRASSPHLAGLKNGTPLSHGSEAGPKAMSTSDAQMAAATRKAVSAALRT